MSSKLNDMITPLEVCPYKISCVLPQLYASIHHGSCYQLSVFGEGAGGHCGLSTCWSFTRPPCDKSHDFVGSVM